MLMLVPFISHAQISHHAIKQISVALLLVYSFDSSVPVDLFSNYSSATKNWTLLQIG